MSGIEILTVTIGACLIAQLIKIYVSKPVFSGIPMDTRDHLIQRMSWTGIAKHKSNSNNIHRIGNYRNTIFRNIRGCSIIYSLMITLCFSAVTANGWGAGATSLIAALSILMVIGYLDIKYNLIPNGLIIFGLILIVACFPLSPLGQEWPVNIAYIKSGLGLIAGFSLMVPIYILFKGRIGAGDIKLCGVLGAALGIDNVLIGLCLGITCGAVLAMGLLVFKKKGIEDVMPYGPSLIAGSALVMCGHSEYGFEFLRSLTYNFS